MNGKPVLGCWQQSLMLASLLDIFSRHWMRFAMPWFVPEVQAILFCIFDVVNVLMKKVN